MATKFNINLIAAVLALAVVGLSFASLGMQGYGASDITVTKISKSCTDTDGWDNAIRGACGDAVNGEPQTYIDSCVDFNTVGEYYCATNNVCQKRMIDCKANEQCVGGACKRV